MARVQAITTLVRGELRMIIASTRRDSQGQMTTSLQSSSTRAQAYTRAITGMLLPRRAVQSSRDHSVLDKPPLAGIWEVEETFTGVLIAGHRRRMLVETSS